MALKAAFIFVAGGANASRHRAVVETPQVSLIVVGVENYDRAEEEAKKLAEEGVGAIELCAGFGAEGTARVKRAVAGKAVVGAVRFDVHPGLDGRSGDEVFG